MKIKRIAVLSRCSLAPRRAGGGVGETDASWSLPVEIFWAWVTKSRPWDRPGTCWKDYISQRASVYLRTLKEKRSWRNVPGNRICRLLHSPRCCCNSYRTAGISLICEHAWISQVCHQQVSGKFSSVSVGEQWPQEHHTFLELRCLGKQISPVFLPPFFVFAFPFDLDPRLFEYISIYRWPSKRKWPLDDQPLHMHLHFLEANNVNHMQVATMLIQGATLCLYSRLDEDRSVLFFC